jgi:hypothetical protein
MYPNFSLVVFLCILRHFGYLFDILVKFLDVITLFSLILLRPLGGVIFGVLVCLISITLFYPLSLC